MSMMMIAKKLSSKATANTVKELNSALDKVLDLSGIIEPILAPLEMITAQITAGSSEAVMEMTMKIVESMQSEPVQAAIQLATDLIVTIIERSAGLMDLMQGLGEAMNIDWEFIAKAGSTLMGILKDIGDIMTDVVEGITKAIDPFVGEGAIVNNLIAFGENVGNALEDAAAAAAEFAQGIGQFFQDLFTNMWEGLTEAANTVAGWFRR